jgi:hypothetical protein
MAKNDLGFDNRTERNRERSTNADDSFNIKLPPQKRISAFGSDNLICFINWHRANHHGLHQL